MVKKLVIIDGKSVFYRGYYAMGALSTADGTPTGGVYGFAVIALEIVRELQPNKVVVAWDKAKTSVEKRKAIYADYKAGRVKPPEDFYAQIPLLRELVTALGWGFLECDGYEADDIIGTLAHQADGELDANGVCEWDTVIVSSDLDMLQVVDENTRMYRLIKGFSQLEEMDVSAVEEKYGILKSQFLDLKALKGDASDNIPGVPGIGEKTAVTLLNQFGSVDGIYTAIAEADALNSDLTDGELKLKAESLGMSPAVLKKLIARRESAMMSYKLGKIMMDAPVKLSEVPDLVIDVPRVEAALSKLEFNSLLRKFKGEIAKLTDGRMSDFKIVNDGKMMSDGKVVDSNKVTSDSETPENDENTKSRAATVATEVLDLKNYVIAPDIKKKMHDEPEVAEEILDGKRKYFDINQAEFLLNPLKRVREDKEITVQGQFNFDETEKRTDEFCKKATEVAEELLKDQKLSKVYFDYDLPLIPVLYKMERRGMEIDPEYFKMLMVEYDGEVAQLEQNIYTIAGMEFNINSPLQLSEVLFDKLMLPTKGIKKTTRGYSTGVKELLKLKDLHPVIPKIMEYRELAKLLSTYIVPFIQLADDDNRIHTTFTQNVTATGRLSSVAPNLQNIPVRTEEGKRIRTGFVAGTGKRLVSADYSQFELRLAAVLAGDEALISDFNSGVDIHTKTAADVFNIPISEVTKTQRRAAKTINFGVMYGMSAKGLSDATEMPVYEAKQFIDDYFEVRKPIRDYLDNVLKQAIEIGYVETYYGRKRPTPDVKSPNFVVRQAAERAAKNMPIQGTEADLMKRAMIKVDALLPDGAALIMQVHDSLIVECDAESVDEVSKVLKTTMEGIAPELNIKLAVEVTAGENWGEL